MSTGAAAIIARIKVTYQEWRIHADSSGRMGYLAELRADRAVVIRGDSPADLETRIASYMQNRRYSGRATRWTKDQPPHGAAQ